MQHKQQSRNSGNKINRRRRIQGGSYKRGLQSVFKDILYNRSSDLNATVPINFSENKAMLFGRTLTNAFIQTFFW